MRLSSDGVHYEFNRGLHWTRITVKLDDGGEAIILVCASGNYIADKYRLQDAVTKRDQESWLNDTLEEIQNSQVTFVAGEVYRKVYSFTSEGHTNGMRFLTEEVVP